MASIDTIIFVGRDSLQFYTNGQILTFPLPATLVKDLEIVDREAFKFGVSGFMDKNSITLGIVAILLSESVCFISEPILKNQSLEDALAPFLSSLPFDNPTARILGDKIVGTNKDLYQLISEIVGQRGGKIKMVSPSFLSKEMFGKKQLDDSMTKFVLSNEEEFSKATFVYEVVLPSQKEETPIEKTKREGKRSLILFSVFFGLLFILVMIWVLTRVL